MATQAAPNQIGVRPLLNCALWINYNRIGLDAAVAALKIISGYSVEPAVCSLTPRNAVIGSNTVP